MANIITAPGEALAVCELRGELLAEDPIEDVDFCHLIL